MTSVLIAAIAAALTFCCLGGVGAIAGGGLVICSGEGDGSGEVRGALGLGICAGAGALCGRAGRGPGLGPLLELAGCPWTGMVHAEKLNSVRRKRILMKPMLA